MAIRGIRGAAVAGEDSPQEVLRVTRELLEGILAQIQRSRQMTWPQPCSPLQMTCARLTRRAPPARWAGRMCR
jgi:chorismate mutase